MYYLSLFFFSLYVDLRDLHSFPTRRSSDLAAFRLLSAERSDEIFPILLEEILSLGFADRKSTRLNSSHVSISYAVFCLKKKNQNCKLFTPHLLNYLILLPQNNQSYFITIGL